MAWADEISNLNTEINKVQHHLDWLNGVNRAYTMEGYTITAAGREGFCLRGEQQILMHHPHLLVKN